jgi:hypothetical protein
MRQRLRLLQNDPDHENQSTNDPNENLGILSPLPICHFALTFGSNETSLTRPIFAGVAEDAWPLYQLALANLTLIGRRILIGVLVDGVAG